MFSVRKADAADTDEIYTLICELESEVMDKTVFSNFFEENIRSGDNIYLTLVADSAQIVGFISCHGQKLLHHPAMVYEIQELIVTEKFRNKGGGKLLLENLEVILRETKYDSLEVTSRIKREGAHRFYIRNGFGQTHFKFIKKPEGGP